MAVGPMSFEGSFLLMVAIVFGLVASVITYLNSRKLKDDVFEMPMIYFALGILFATISLISVTFFASVFGESNIALIHDLSFIVGLALMLTASIKITNFLRRVENFETKLPKKVDQ